MRHFFLLWTCGLYPLWRTTHCDLVNSSTLITLVTRKCVFSSSEADFPAVCFFPDFWNVAGLLEWRVDHPLGRRPCTTTIEAITFLRVFLFFFSLISFALYFSKYQGYGSLRESFAIATTRTMMSVSSWRR